MLSNHRLMTDLARLRPSLLGVWEHSLLRIFLQPLVHIHSKLASTGVLSSLMDRSPLRRLQRQQCWMETTSTALLPPRHLRHSTFMLLWSMASTGRCGIGCSYGFTAQSQCTLTYMDLTIILFNNLRRLLRWKPGNCRTDRPATSRF